MAEADSGVSDAVGVARLAAAWALAALNEVRGYLYGAGATAFGRGARVWLGFHVPSISRAALILGFEIVHAAMREDFRPEEFDPALERLWGSCRKEHPDFQARMLMRAARTANIPFLPLIEGARFWQFGWGRRSRVFFETASNADGYLGGDWQRSKPIAKALLRSLGMPTADHVLVRQEDELPAAAERIGFPCVVKPASSGGGRGVTTNLWNHAELAHAFHYAQTHGEGPVMVEAMVPGEDHRLMVIGGELVAVIKREATYVTGDALRTVSELIAERNSVRSANLVRSRYLYPIKIDAVLREHLESQGVSLDDVLPAGQRVTLRSNANRSTGGLCTDVTPAVHPQVRAMAEQLAKIAGLFAVGVDYLTTDISRPPAEVGGAIIEFNATPGLSACVAGGFDEIELAKRILGDGLGRIPVDLTVVYPGHQKEMLASLQGRELEVTAGWVCGEELRVGGAVLTCQSDWPWAAVHAALRNRVLESLHIICTPQDIVSHGLPVDKLRRATVAAPDLPEGWKSILSRCARETSFHVDRVEDK